ncbi:MAG: ATP synthase F1 subunit epsilon [Bacillota bacterium]|nr:ATP synthase F1 subunit epsilon [Bacillota bacterium]
MNSFHIQIYATDRTFYEGPCESIIIPTNDGFYGIQANHTNSIHAIIPGQFTYRIPGEENQIAVVGSGMVKVENNQVLMLIESIERPEEIDVNRARRAADRAKEEILQKRSIREYTLAQAHLSRALNRLKVKKHQINL